MARSPKPKNDQADGVLDDAAPVAEAAPVADVTPAAAPVAEVAPDGATQPADAMGAIVPPPDLTAAEAAFAATAPASVEPEVAPVVRVRALQPQRWRIGRAFGAEPVDIPATDLTEAEADALMADPLLSVTLIDPA